MKSQEHHQSKVGAGKSIVNRHERSFRRGSLMFIEGESSTEMFIVRSGCVRILKQEGEHTVELAQLGPGSVLGELSLLDHQPRSATAQVMEDTSVTVIDEELFTRTLKNIPNWLENMIQLVVKRLRDTMKKTSDDMVYKSIGGVIQIILLMLDALDGNNGDAEEELLVSHVREKVLAVIGLGGVEVENIFLHLILKELILIKKNDAGQEYITITDADMLQLYMQYFRIHQRGGELVGENFNTATFDLLEAIREAGSRNGKKISSKFIGISEQQIEIELARMGKERFIDRDALECLIGSKLLIPDQTKTESKFGHHKQTSYIYNPDLMGHVAALKKWLPVFREEVKF